MKTLIIFLFVVATATFSQAQEVTRLGEVKVGFAPINTKIIKTPNGFTFVIDKVRSIEFTSNPIGFMYDNFDIENFITTLDDDRYSNYEVSLECSRGSMVAFFDTEGNLMSTRQNFKDVLLPLAQRREVYKNYKGWTMTKNKYRATTKGKVITDETFKITLQKGDRKQRIKIAGNNQGISLASN